MCISYWIHKDDKQYRKNVNLIREDIIKNSCNRLELFRKWEIATLTKRNELYSDNDKFDILCSNVDGINLLSMSLFVCNTAAHHHKLTYINPLNAIFYS